MKYFVVCITVILTVYSYCGVNVVEAQSTQEIAQKALGSTVLLVMEDDNGQPFSLGSGFFVRNNQIATNLHVVSGAAKGYARLVGKKTKYNIEGITAVDSARDLVILKISALGTQGIPLGNSDMVQIGESIYAVGNPRGLEGTFSQGIISSIRKVGTDKIFQLTAPISPGSSGGPVLNDKGEVIGVSVATYRGGQNLNFAIPSNYLTALKSRIGLPKPLANSKTAKTQRSLLDDLGGKSAEGVSATSFAWEDKEGSKYNVYASYSSKRYTFSLRNKLRESVKNLYCVVIFYDKQGDPIDSEIVLFDEIILPGLAKRVTGQEVSHESVKEMSTNYSKASRYNITITETRVKFRILDFEIVE